MIKLVTMYSVVCDRCANSTLKCKNHAWNVLNSRLIYDWIQRERSDNKCVIFKENYDCLFS